MKAFLLVLALSSSGKALVVVPTEYISEAKCIEAGKAFVKQIDNVSAVFACIPSGATP